MIRLPPRVAARRGVHAAGFRHQRTGTNTPHPCFASDAASSGGLSVPSGSTKGIMYHLPTVTAEEAYPPISSKQNEQWQIVIDARSPHEHAEDHIPRAINCPVLDDSEHCEVGTLHKSSPVQARLRGGAIVAANISSMLSEGSKLHQILRTQMEGVTDGRRVNVLVYCWRGGERSRALAHVLSRIGGSLHVCVLEGGYRAYRKKVRNFFEVEGKNELETVTFVRVAGQTGVGKTALLHELAKQGAQVLDLEGLANHRGSILGDMQGTKQPSQKRFESRIMAALHCCPQLSTRPVYVESESNRIGKLQVPPLVFQRMLNSHQYCTVVAPLALRVARIREEYRFLENAAHGAHLGRCLRTLKRVAGKAAVERWEAMVMEEDFDGLVQDLLVVHYDAAYHRANKRYKDRLDANNIDVEHHIVTLETGLHNEMSTIAGKLIDMENGPWQVPLAQA